MPLRRARDVLRSAAGASADDRLLARAAVRAAAAARGSTVATGRRIVWPSSGRAQLETFVLPRAGAGEVTVELAATVVSPGTERAQYLRLPSARPSFPHRPGYAGAGVVVAAGRSSGFAPGDAVAVPRAPHASVVTVPASEVYRVPAGVGLPEAALTYLAIIAANGVERCRLASGDTLCIVGAGTIGLLAQRLAAARGLRTVVVARSDRARSLVETDGSIFLRADEDAVGEVGAAGAIDAVGGRDTLTTAAAAAGDGARVVLLGSPRAPQVVPLAVIGAKRLVLVGAHVSRLPQERAATGRDDLARFAHEFLDAVAAGRIDASALLGDPLDPREPELFYRRLASGETTGGWFDWSSLRDEPVEPASAPASRSRSRRVGFVVVGCGDIGAANAAAVAATASGTVVACYDRDPALGRAVADAHGAHAAPTLDAALETRGVEAVVVSVPHAAHEEVALEAIARGLHLVVEKPLAHDLASARRIADAAAGAGVAASVCLPFRYEAPVVAAKRLADGGALGRFAGCAITVLMDKPPSYWAGGYSGRATSDWRTTRAAAGGGVLIMNATHYVDWALYLSGARVEEVAAFWRGDEAVGDVEDALAAALRFDGGAVGTIVCASSARGGSSASGVTLWGDLGQLIVGDISRAFTLRHVAGRTAARWHELPQGGEDARVVYFERFADAVLDERPPEITLADGLAVQEVVEAAYASAASGAPVRIGETAVARA